MPIPDLPGASITIVCNKLNAACKTQLQVAEDMVVASLLVEPDGMVAPAISNKLVFTTIYTEYHNKVLGGNEPQIKMDVLVTASFSSSNYSEGLKLLDFAAGFLLSKPSIEIPTEAGHSKTIAISQVALSLAEQAQLWQMLGTHHRPSLLFRFII